MKDLTAILAAADRLTHAGEEAVLVTLVKTQGSTYRKPGARMLILPGCRTIGTISGGCLEPAVARQAWDVTRNGKSVVFTVDSSPEDDDWKPATGCHGKLFLLAERIPPGQCHPALQCIKQVREQRTPVWLLHEFAVQPDGTLAFLHLHRESADHLDDSQWINNAAMFAEHVRPLPHVLVCGAGDDARPVAQMAHELGWLVTILDSRPRLATKERFPMAHFVSAEGPNAVAPLVTLDTVAVIMSHRYLDDVNYLANLPHRCLPYIGVLGPRRRTDQIFSDLATRNITLSPCERSHIHTPAGLDLGGEGPESIALSIIAHIQKTLFYRTKAC